MNQEVSNIPTIVLASSSPRRKELLGGLGIPFVVMPSDFDESAVHEADPARLVEQLAFKKAEAVMERLDRNHEARHLVIGADTVVVLGQDVLGKPTNTDHAKHMLRRLQGKTHTVYSGLCVMGYAGGDLRVQTAHEKTLVHMGPMSDDIITRYVATGEPMDKAGAYAIQGIGATLVTGIEGDYFTVVGLPIHRLAAMLTMFGMSVV